MKQYEILKNQVEQIAKANSVLKDSKLSLMLNMLESIAKRIEKLDEEKLLHTAENKFYPRSYEFYTTAAGIRLNLLKGEVKDYYQIPGFNNLEDIDNIFDGFVDKYTVGIYSDKSELPENLTGSYMITENKLKIYFLNSEAQLAGFKKENTVVLRVINTNI